MGSASANSHTSCSVRGTLKRVVLGLSSCLATLAAPITMLANGLAALLHNGPPAVPRRRPGAGTAPAGENCRVCCRRGGIHTAARKRPEHSRAGKSGAEGHGGAGRFADEVDDQFANGRSAGVRRTRRPFACE